MLKKNTVNDIIIKSHSKVIYKCLMFVLPEYSRMEICNKIKYFFLITIISVAVFVVALSYYINSSYERRNVYRSTDSAAAAIELVLSSQLMSNTESVENEQVLDVLNYLLRNDLSALDVDAAWVAENDPVNGIIEQSVYDKAIGIKPGDYLFTDSDIKHLYVQSQGAGYCLTLKKSEETGYVFAAARKELPAVAMLVSTFKNYYLLMIVFFCLFLCVLWFIKAFLFNYFTVLNTQVKRMVDEPGYEPRGSELLLWDKRFRLGRNIIQLKRDLAEKFGQVELERDRSVAALKSGGCGVIVINQDSVIVSIDILAQEITGRYSEDTVGNRFDDIFTLIRYKTNIKLSLSDLINNAGSFDDLPPIYKLGREDDNLVYLSVSVSALKNENGKAVEFVILIRDISKEVFNKDNLEDSRARLKHNADNLHMIFEVAKIATWEYNITEKLLYGGNDFYNLLGLHDAESLDIANDFLSRVKHSGDIRKFMAEIGTYYEEHFSARFSFEGEDSVVRRLLCCGKADVNANGSPAEFARGIIIDVTEEEVIHEELKTQSMLNMISNKRLQQVYDMAKMFFWEYDEKNDLISGDENFLKEFIRFDEKICTGSIKTVYQMMHPEFREKVRDVIKEAKKRHEKGCVFEFTTLPDNDNNVRYMKNYMNFDYDGQGNAIASYGMVLDITAEHEHQLRLVHRSKMESVGTLSGGIAHDFNNILSGVLGMVELVEKKVKGNSSVFEYCSNIRELCERAGEFTGKLLSFSRKSSAVYENMKISEIVGNTAVILRHSITTRIGVDFETEFEDAVVQGSVSELQNLVLNLGINARDAIIDKNEGDESFNGVLNLRVKPYDKQGMDAYPVCGKIDYTREYVCIQVEDNGVGIGKDKMSKIFEPFYTTKPKDKGTGLGLSMIEETISAHHGAIYLSSIVGVGTKFDILLPLVVNDNDGENACSKGKDETELLTLAEVEGAMDEHARRTILVVDDEPVMRFIYNQLFTEQGYTVIEAVDGRDGVEKYKENQSEVIGIIMDLQMPEMDGKEAFEKILEIEPEVRLVFVSGYLGKASQKELLDMGAVEVMAKPFRKKSFVRKITSIFAL